MIVQLFIKIVLFYFAFSVIRNLIRGVSQVKSSSEAFKKKFDASENQGPSAQRSKKGDEEDIVEAEFRRL